MAEVVNHTKVTRIINYGDGYDGVTYEFSEPINRADFLEFCKEADHSLDKMNDYGWYENHPEVYPYRAKSGEIIHRSCTNDKMSVFWTWFMVHPYTD